MQQKDTQEFPTYTPILGIATIDYSTGPRMGFKWYDIEGKSFNAHSQGMPAITYTDIDFGYYEGIQGE